MTLEWVPVGSRLPVVEEGADGTSVLLFWDGAAVSGWPVDTSGDDPEGWSWESAEWPTIGLLYGVTHWARWERPRPKRQGKSHAKDA